MTLSELDIVSAFVDGAPPGEVGRDPPLVKHLTDTYQARRCYRRCDRASFIAIATDYAKNADIDIKALTVSSPTIISQLGPAFEKYNEEQFTTVKLPGSSQSVSPTSSNICVGYS